MRRDTNFYKERRKIEADVLDKISSGWKYTEVAEQLGVSFERVRQIYAKARWKLRNDMARADLVSVRVTVFERERAEILRRVKRLADELERMGLGREIAAEMNGISTTSLDLSFRAKNGLLKMGINSAEDIEYYTEREMIMAPNFGRKSLNEVKELCANLGFRIGSKKREKS